MAGLWDRGRRSVTVGLLATVSITAFEALAVATVLPVTARDLGGLEWYGWVFSSFMLASLVSITVAGAWADRGGLVGPFAIGSALFAGGLVVAGLAPAMPVVILGRVAQGAGAGAISAVSYVAVARVYDADARPRMLALLSSAWVLPGLIGPGTAGMVADLVGWRWVFLGLVPPTLLAAGLAAPGLHRLARATATDGDAGRIRAALLLAAGSGLVLVGLETGASWRALAVVGAGAALGVPALLRLMPAGTLCARPGAPAAVATMALLCFAFFGTEAFLPLALIDLRGQAVAVAGLALTAGTLGWCSGAWLQVRLLASHSRSTLVRLGLALTVLGVVGASSALEPTIPAPVVAAGWAVAGLGIGIAFATISLIVLEGAAAGAEGTAAAALQLANVLGIALGTGVGGAALQLALGAGWGQARGLLAVDVVMVAAGVLGLLAAGRARDEPVDPAARPAVAGARRAG
jgi:MFS family permease